ncbi:hypothetical protein ACFL6P_09975 [Candidatus Latescibacterota bacterium]
MKKIFIVCLIISSVFFFGLKLIPDSIPSNKSVKKLYEETVVSIVTDDPVMIEQQKNEHIDLNQTLNIPDNPVERTQKKEKSDIPDKAVSSKPIVTKISKISPKSGSENKVFINNNSTESNFRKIVEESYVTEVKVIPFADISKGESEKISEIALTEAKSIYQTILGVQMP